jgi:hypothetical protein
MKPNRKQRRMFEYWLYGNYMIVMKVKMSKAIVATPVSTLKESLIILVLHT